VNLKNCKFAFAGDVFVKIFKFISN